MQRVEFIKLITESTVFVFLRFNQVEFASISHHIIGLDQQSKMLQLH